jgi:site-specific DNA recombinase
LFPAEQARIVQLLVERIDVAVDGMDIRLRVEGLTELVQDLGNDSRGDNQANDRGGAQARRAA